MSFGLPDFRRLTAALLVFAQVLLLLVRCSGGQRIESSGEEYPPLPSPRADQTPIRIVILPFRNSADLSEFDIIPDGDYRKHIFIPGRHETGSAEPIGDKRKASETKIERDSRKPADIESFTDRKTESEPRRVRSGLVAREVTETALLKSGRFEIVPLFRYRQRLAEYEKNRPGNPLNSLSAARDLQVRYLLNGDLTNFEIRQKRSYWKIPLWVILLIAALLIKDDDLRKYAIYTLARIMFFTPLNSFLWKAGLGWEDLDLEVDVGLNLRAVDTHTGSVAFASTREVTRTDSVRNIDLLLWASNKRIKITRSNAGRQIRYAAHYLVTDLVQGLDADQVK